MMQRPPQPQMPNAPMMQPPAGMPVPGNTSEEAYMKTCMAFLTSKGMAAGQKAESMCYRMWATARGMMDQQGNMNQSEVAGMSPAQKVSTGLKLGQ